MFTENQKLDAYNVLSSMAMVVSDTQCLADIEDQKADLATLERAFLSGEWADDCRLRNSILLLLDNIDKYYDMVAQYSQEEITSALQLLQNFRNNDILQK